MEVADARPSEPPRICIGGRPPRRYPLPEWSHESGAGELSIGAGRAVIWGRAKHAGPYRFG
jgi:hypothetical protein